MLVALFGFFITYKTTFFGEHAVSNSKFLKIKYYHLNEHEVYLQNASPLFGITLSYNNPPDVT